MRRLSSRLQGLFARPLCWGPLVAALVGAGVLWLAVDQLWWTLLFGYGPRWIWWPLLILPLLARCGARERLLATVLTTVVVLFGLQGFQLPIGREPRPDPANQPLLRVVTFNAGVRGQALPGAISLAVDVDADVLIVVECPPFRGAAIERFRALGITRAGEVCVWQRSGDATTIQLAERPVREIGWSGTIGAVRGVEGVSGPIGVVHLRSVRNELSEFLDLSEVLGQADSMAARQRKRIGGSSFASAWLATEASGRPSIVVGDFNLVSESAVFRRDWGSWQDAFAVAGLGYGHTWNSSWYGLRIDHVLADSTWLVHAARVGPDLGSDHRPLIVELSRRSEPSGQ